MYYSDANADDDGLNFDNIDERWLSMEIMFVGRDF